MKTNFLTAFEKWANWKSILALFGLQTLFVLVILPGASSGNTTDLPSLDMQFWYTPQRAYQIISAHSPETLRAMAITRLTIDIIYPLVYGLMISFLLIVSFRRAFPPSMDDSARSMLLQRSSLMKGETASSREHAPRGGISDFIVFIPWGGVFFDYLENISLATMYLSYPTKLIPLAWMASIFTAIKWALIGIGFALVLIGAVKLAFTKKE
ncbi:MAG: hypothetical protein B5M51_04560 [Anaerolinea sp. 4484_236]|nr:MAG: hypothetical protein B5M51_04560 [Anaerolinea sp. 4484_236]